MKAYTDIEQSKKLAEFLPIESADMAYWKKSYLPNDYAIMARHTKELQEGFEAKGMEYIPCWSLAALLDIIPYPTLSKHADETWSCASWMEKIKPYFVEGCDSPINACYEMIIKLKERDLI